MSEETGFLLLNIDYALHSPKNTDLLTMFMLKCEQQNVRLILAGSKSVRELRNLKPNIEDDGFKNRVMRWLEAVNRFSTITLPVYYGVNRVLLTAECSENEYLNILNNEIEYGPHQEELSLMLSRELSET